MSTRRAGRRPGDPSATKATILASALRAFASVGYDRATIRSIAKEADVDPALVNHHFGTKEALFHAAHKANPDRGSSGLVSTGASSTDHAEAVTRNWLMRYTTQGTVEQSLLKSAMTHPPAADRLSEIVARDAIAITNALRIDAATDETVELIRSLLLGAAVVCHLEQPRSRSGACVDSKATEMLSVLRDRLTDHSLP